MRTIVRVTIVLPSGKVTVKDSGSYLIKNVKDRGLKDQGTSG